MNLAQLRELITPLLTNFNVTHQQLPALRRELGIPEPTAGGTKRELLSNSMQLLADTELPRVAEVLLRVRPPTPEARNRIQDILWADSGRPAIPKRFRREVARVIAPEDLYLDARRFDELIEGLWILEPDFFTSHLGLRGQIQRHVHANPGDWTADDLFSALGAYDSSDERFARFLEGLASADVRPDEAEQRRFVASLNTALNSCGAELRETSSADGYPVFSLVSVNSLRRGGPKNLVFASSVKPDMRFRDALDNDVEVVNPDGQVLMYDRAIGQAGLRWHDLQLWWSESENIVDPLEAKTSLYRRLLRALPDSSPPQQRFFVGFFRAYREAIHGLPALLPEVWLHWDPKTVEERGKDALLRFRMDFLMLLPHGVRIVIEVDGKQHYSDAAGHADVARYAALVGADRDLKLAGYEVFRFGTAELQDATTEATVQHFFDALFRRFGVDVSGPNEVGRK